MCKSLVNMISFCKRSSLLSRFLVVTMTALVSIAGTAHAADPKVQIFSGTDEHWVPLQVAKAKGFFAAEGVDAQVTVFTTDAEAFQTFKAGRGDFISAGDLPSTAMWKAANVIGVAPMSSDTEIFGIVGKSDISSPKDLRGRKVATRFGSTGEFLLYRYLASGDVMPSEVSIVNLAPPEMVLSLVHGNIDAFAWLAPFTSRAMSTGTNIKLISSAKGLASNRIILSVTKSFREEKPRLVTKVMRAIRRGIEFTRTNPEEATQLWAKAVQGDVKQSLPVVRLISYDMKFDDAFVNDMNELAKFMTQKRALKEPINWSTDMDTTFLRRIDPGLVTASSPK